MKTFHKNMLKFFKERFFKPAVLEDPKRDIVIGKNPYLQSKALWNDLYGDTVNALTHSRRLNILLGGLLLLCVIGLIISAGRTKIRTVPFIVHGDEVITLTDSSQSAGLTEKLAPYFAGQFIRSSRSVSTDTAVNAGEKIAAYSFVSGAAAEILKNFYLKNNADIISQHFVKNIDVTSVLSLSPHTFSIRWRENFRNAQSGELIKSQNYIAQLTYSYKKPSQNETVLKNNPMGFYITELSWAPDQN